MDYECSEGPFTISTDPARLNIDTIHTFLSQSAYWAIARSRETVVRSIKHSLCFGVYEGQIQVGFGRIVSDYATFAYLADVFVLPSHRGRGLSKWLMRCILAHPDLQGLRRFHLVTNDAQELYRQFAFTPLAHPDRHMERVSPPS